MFKSDIVKKNRTIYLQPVADNRSRWARERQQPLQGLRPAGLVQIYSIHCEPTLFMNYISIFIDIRKYVHEWIKNYPFYTYVFASVSQKESLKMYSFLCYLLCHSVVRWVSSTEIPHHIIYLSRFLSRTGWGKTRR